LVNEETPELEIAKSNRFDINNCGGDIFPVGNFTAAQMLSLQNESAMPDLRWSGRDNVGTYYSHLNK
jgi:hypothetical protein